jgi:hypothetical protein
MANALNVLHRSPLFSKDEFVREAGVLFQPKLGGTLPFLKVWQLQRRGYGSHFGRLAHTDGEQVLRGLIDQGVPMIVDIYPAFQLGSLRIYGLHATVLVGYSDPYIDAHGQRREEYYLIDAEWPKLGEFQLSQNDVDRDGDGVAEHYPGNRTLTRAEFLGLWSSRNYAPIFRSQREHDEWYRRTIQPVKPWPVIGRLAETLLFGSDDRLIQPTPTAWAL